MGATAFSSFSNSALVISVLQSAGWAADVVAEALFAVAEWDADDFFPAVLEEPAARMDGAVFAVPFRETSQTPWIVMTGEFSGTTAVDGGVGAAGAGAAAVVGAELCPGAGVAGAAPGALWAATNELLAMSRTQKNAE